MVVAGPGFFGFWILAQVCCTGAGGASGGAGAMVQRAAEQICRDGGAEVLGYAEVPQR